MVCCCICDFTQARESGAGQNSFSVRTHETEHSGLSVFYRNLLRFGSLFVFKQTEDPQSLYWLLEEPLVRGEHVWTYLQMDLFQDLTKHSFDNKVVTLGQLLETAGLDFKNDEAIALRLGFRSTRLVAQLLLKWRAALKPTELIFAV